MTLGIELLSNRRGRVFGSRKIISEIDEYLAEEDPRARFATSYKKGFWDGKVRFIDMHGNFPIGLFPRIYALCTNKLGQVPELYDNREFEPPKIYTIPNVLGGKVLRDYQNIMASKALYRKVGDVPFPRGIIAAATNAGKSLISAAIAWSLMQHKIDILFLCHRAEIFDQIVDWYGEYLDTDIGRYNAKVEDIRNVTIAMITTLYSRRKSVEVQAILGHFGCLIVDEAHHGSSKSWAHIIASSNAYYKFGLSGTAFQSEPHRNTQLRGLFGPVVARITNKQLVNRSFSAVPHIAFINYEPEPLYNDPKISDLMDMEKNLIRKQKAVAKRFGIGMGKEEMLIEMELRKLRRELYTLVYERGICKSVFRTECIADIVADHEDDQVLIVVNKISHGNFIKEILNANGIEAIFVNGETPDKERSDIRRMFADGDIKVLIATLIYKEGVDLPAIDILVIAVGEKAPHTILQTFGRGLRTRKDKDRVNVYDFMDRSHRVLERHSIHRIKIYKEEGFDPKFIEM